MPMQIANFALNNFMENYVKDRSYKHNRHVVMRSRGPSHANLTDPWGMLILLRLQYLQNQAVPIRRY